MEQGRKEQQVETLKQILQTRFATVPDVISTALARCTLEQLQALVNPALDAADLNTFLAQIPEPKSNGEANNPVDGNPSIV